MVRGPTKSGTGYVILSNHIVKVDSPRIVTLKRTPGCPNDIKMVQRFVILAIYGNDGQKEIKKLTIHNLIIEKGMYINMCAKEHKRLGKFTQFYPRFLLAKSRLKRRVINGPHWFYHETTMNPRRYCEYVDNKRHGRLVEYDEAGKPILTRIYFNDEFVEEVLHY